MTKEQEAAAAAAAPATVTDEDLKKALDENLAAVTDILKSEDADSDLRKALEDPAKRAEIEEFLKAKKAPPAAKEEGEEEEGEEGEEGEEEEGEEEEAPAPRGRMKKSMDDVDAAAGEIEEFVSANELIKSVVDALKTVGEEVVALRSEVDSLRKSSSATAKLVASEVAMVKSVDEIVRRVAGAPMPVKGVTMAKSAGSETHAREAMAPAAFKNALIKACTEGAVPSGLLTKLEMSRFNQGLVDDDTFEKIKSFASK